MSNKRLREGPLSTFHKIYLQRPLPVIAIPAILRFMLTMKRIREILSQNGLAPHEVDDIARYCETVQCEITEEDVKALANIKDR